MANIQKFCPKGHAYDSSLPACPYCSPSQNDDKSTKTDTLVQENNKCKLCPKGHYYPSFLPECPFCPSKKIVEPPPPPPPPPRVRPVLVCLQGSDFGKDFELYPNVTHIGLDASQGVCLSDKNVSPEHFTIFYDKKHNRYFADIDTDSTPVYINDYPCGDTRTELKWGDQIKVGETLLGFIPLGQKVESLSVRPVVGWLVCVQGPDIGKDFRLHSDFNHVGRDKYQDVCLSDRTVSREHFTVSYDIVNNHYFAEMDKGRTMVYINGYPLGGRALLKKGDQIKVGETLLVFIPLEQKDVKWTYEQDVKWLYELER